MKIYNPEGKIISGFVFALLVIGVFSWITYRNMRLTNADSKEVNTSLHILKSVENVFTGAQDVYAGYCDYIITGDENCLIPVNEAVKQSSINVNNLISSSEIDSARERDARLLSGFVNAQLAYSKKVIETTRSKGVNAAIAFVKNDEGIALMNNIRYLVNKIEDRERTVLTNENIAKAERSDRTVLLFITLAAGVFIFLLLCFVMIRNDSIVKKRANERITYLANLIEQTSDAIISIDQNRLIKSWNKGAEKMYGYYAWEAIGKTTVELLSSNVDVEELKHFMEHAETGEYWDVEVIHKRKDQIQINVSSSITNIKDSNGNLIGFVGVNKDITARKKLEEQLRKFNEELSQTVKEKTSEIENIFDRINEGFVTLDNQLVFTYANKNACALFHKKPEELIGKKATDVFPSIVNIPVYQASLDAQKSRSSIQVENFSPLLQKWFQNTIYPTAEGISIFFHDVTEERKNREALRASEEKYRLLVEEASDAIFISDQSGNYTDVNSKACELLGYTREELLNINSKDILYVEEDREQLDLRFKELMDGKSFITERKLKRKNGTSVDVETNGKMLPDGRFMGIVRNITERKKAEEALRESELRYRSLVEQASDGIFLYDYTGKIIDVNSGGGKMLWYSMEEIKLLKIQDLFFEEDIKQTPLRFKEQLEGKTVLSERSLKRKDGSSVAVEINTRMLADNNFLGIVRDITNRKQTEKELQQMNSQLRDLNSSIQTVREEERTNIAREIHDELGQQLTALKMDASWLNKKIMGNAVMTEKINDMISLIDETVKIVRRISADLRPIILDDIGLIAALEWYSAEFEKRTGIPCSFQSVFSELQLSKEIAICVFRIYQETLTNVARHSEATQVETKVDKVSETLLLTIKDNGKGFDSLAVRNKRTLGILGMKERAGMCGGNFSIESIDRKGTTVTLTLPLKIEKENQVVIL